ncbi:hypothetical protein D3C79_1044640 [compost metagenome]
MHREAELGGGERLFPGQVAEEGEGAWGFPVPADEHQRQVLQPFGQRPADGEGHACQAAQASALHGRQKRHIRRLIGRR